MFGLQVVLGGEAAQAFERESHSSFYGSQRDSDHFGDLGVGKTVKIGEPENGKLLLGELCPEEARGRARVQIRLRTTPKTGVQTALQLSPAPPEAARRARPAFPS